MALRRCKQPNELQARLVTGEKSPCVFCQREIDDELVYGKLYAIGDIQCHYFCVLLSCCLIQKGRDEDGLFGFLYKDILIEVERSKKHRCSYCGRGGATLGCCVTQCRKQFHLPCGRERNAVSLFYGNYKSYCQLHAPKQKIPESIMAKAKLRKKEASSRKAVRPKQGDNDCQQLDMEYVCVICYEEVDAYPTLQTFWPPCCARDAWFHRSCLQRMALSAGMHYLKCPLCNDKENFHEAIVGQGYYIPDRDAAWELEQNAFAEIYERPLSCSAVECLCPMGRSHDSDTGMWDIKLCILCGSSGAHAHCLAACASASAARHVCAACRPAAPSDLDSLATTIEAVILAEQNQAAEQVRHGPVMPSRMSLRRTKRDLQNIASTSKYVINIGTEVSSPKDLTASRQELNIKTPRKLQTISDPVLQNIDNKLLSPTKMLEQSFKDKVLRMGVENVELNGEVIEEIHRRFKKPKPLSEKRRIMNDILDGLFDNVLKEPKHKEKVKEWCSPRKCGDMKEESLENSAQATTKHSTDNTCSPRSNTKSSLKTPHKDLQPNIQISTESDDSSSTFHLPPEFIAEHNSDDSLPIFNTPKKLKTVDIQKDSSLEISENDQIINIDVVKMEDSSQNNDFIKRLNLKSPVKNKKCAFKFSPLDKEKLQENNVDIDLESFKNHYLNEVDRDFKVNITTNVKENDLNKDSNENTVRKSSKRKLHAKKQKNGCKKRKMSGEKAEKVVLKYNKANKNTEKFELSVDSKKSEKRSKLKKKLKTKLSIRDNNIKVKIKWRKELLKLKITESKRKRTKKSNIPDNKNPLKQYVLQYFQDQGKEVIVKPEKDVTPLKRKYIKQEKSPDNLVQTSIHRFFTTKDSKD